MCQLPITVSKPWGNQLIWKNVLLWHLSEAAAHSNLALLFWASSKAAGYGGNMWQSKLDISWYGEAKGQKRDRSQIQSFLLQVASVVFHHSDEKSNGYSVARGSALVRDGSK